VESKCFPLLLNDTINTIEVKETIMRDYIVNEVQSRQAYGRVTWLVRMVGNWRMRSDLKRLRKYSDYQLRDIGLERQDLERLIAAPLNFDHTWHLEKANVSVSSQPDCLALPTLGRAVFTPLLRPHHLT
jgi:uncharacterized protein YjiS (DUF1127 family)